MQGLGPLLSLYKQSKLVTQGMPALEGHSWLLRRHGDEVERLPGGFYVAHGRCDDTMNLGGIKVPIRYVTRPDTKPCHYSSQLPETQSCMFCSFAGQSLDSLL